MNLLTEYAASRPDGVDRESHVIRGVKVLGMTSSNGRDYSPAAVDAALGLYEGTRVYVDHSNESARSYRDKIGQLKNATRKTDGIYADLHLNPKHPIAESVLWDAENSADTFGLSQVAEAKVRRVGKRDVVESILKVRSVDVVSVPATTRGLFEMEDDKERSPNAIETFAEQAREIGAGEGEQSDKVQRLVALAESALGLKLEQPKPVEEQKPDGEKPDRSADEVARLTRESAAYRVLAECRVVPDPVRVKALAALDTDDERKTLCESWKPAPSANPAARSGQRQGGEKRNLKSGMTVSEYLASRQ